VNKIVQPPPPTGRPAPAPAGRGAARRHLTRHDRETRLHRLIIGAVGLAFLVVLLVPAIGYYREVLTKGAQPIARVEGEEIDLDTFSKVYGYRQISLDAQLGQMRQLSTGQNAGIFQQQIQQLESQRTALDTTVLNELIEQRLIAKEAEARGIAVTRADEDARIEKEFAVSPQPTPSPDPSATAGPQATPLATANPYDRLKTALDNIKVLNEAEFRQLVIRPELLSERLQDSFAKDVPASEPQIHARHILLETEEAARAARERLDKGEPFEKVAGELSKDSSNKDQGGDLGWFGKGKMTKPFEDSAFELPVNQVSEPIKSAFGWHLIQVLERDENRPLGEEQKVQKRGELFKDWLEKRKDEGFNNNTIQYEYSSDKIAWARAQVNKARGLPKGAE
jgi:parvulin-like peptidyl-prolyl isomerase